MTAAPEDLHKLKPIERIEKAPEGHYLTYIPGNERPLSGAPMQTSLWLMDPLKQIIRPAIRTLAGFYREFSKKPNEFVPQVKHVWKMFEILKRHETCLDMVQLWDDLQILVCFFLEEDKAYLWRLETLAEDLGYEPLKPDENERYYLERKRDYKYRLP